MSSKQRLSVLVVDEDEATTIALKEFLNHDGYRVQSLSDPSRAGEEVREGTYQIVLLDVSPGGLIVVLQTLLFLLAFLLAPKHGLIPVGSWFRQKRVAR